MAWYSRNNSTFKVVTLSTNIRKPPGCNVFGHGLTSSYQFRGTLEELMELSLAPLETNAAVLDHFFPLVCTIFPAFEDGILAHSPQSVYLYMDDRRPKRHHRWYVKIIWRINTYLAHRRETKTSYHSYHCTTDHTHKTRPSSSSASIMNRRNRSARSW